MQLRTGLRPMLCLLAIDEALVDALPRDVVQRGVGQGVLDWPASCHACYFLTVFEMPAVVVDVFANVTRYCFLADCFTLMLPLPFLNFTVLRVFHLLSDLTWKLIE